MTIFTGSTIIRIPTVGGISRLSELTIDVDKDWSGKSILNVGNIGMGTSTPSERLHVVGNTLVTGFGNLGSLRIGGTEVIDSSRILKNVLADASIITSGRLSLSRLPTSDVANRVLAVRTAGGDPVYDQVRTADILDGAITTTKIADGAVSFAKCASEIVTHASRHASGGADPLPSGSISSAMIIDEAVTTAKLSTLDFVTFISRTSDPSLSAGRVWFRSDLGLLSYSPDGSTVRRIPFGSINVDAHAGRHASGGADAITSKLDYRAMNIIRARATATSTFSTTSTSFVDIPGLSVSVSLPASSCVLVFSQVWAVYSVGAYPLYQRIVRGTTPLRDIAILSGDINVYRNSIIQTLEINVPSGTHTYKLQGCVGVDTVGYWVMSASPSHGEISVIAFPY